ncbi:cold-responsive protein kinase 1-like [Bidens hawaiensis]|uniref:cold-responsive protein kinase 1-like n=1 Tax=Bidens hawaiensis TaxID=980011 RepID=UPI00404A5797
MSFLVVFLVLLLIKQGFSQSNDRDNNSTDLQIAVFCGRNTVISLPNFINNRNSTFNDLRMQLLNQRALYARAQTLSAGVSVFAAAQCRDYLSVDQCVACFDTAVSNLVNCTFNGGSASLDNCFLRYEDFSDFYNSPYVAEDANGTPTVLCGTQSASQPTVFNQVVDGLLSDIRDATPKTSKLYVASTRQITGENKTVYVTAQCAGNINKAICQTCMDRAYDKINDCLPNTEGRISDMGCFARYSDTPFFNVNQTTDITNVSKGHSSKVAIIAAVVGGVVLIFLILLSWLLYRSWNKSKETEEADFEGAVHYNYKDLQIATDNFSEENFLGKGGFGEVFKAVLEDNNVVAVKKVLVQHAGAKEEFENEVKLISNIHHRNLLRLLGWSIEGTYLLLVLEYMPNGSLDQFLWGSKRGTLNWNQRYEIIFGIARGLAHLHDEFHIKIVHRDIKSSNILLSDDFKPKIADFGLARFQPEDQTHVSTKFAGTLGYTAPEYALHGVLSEKVDTYSFGIVILEIISGKRSTDVNSGSQSTDYLLENTWKLYERNIHIKVVDETLNLNRYEQEHVMKIIEIALLCTQSPASNRPTMSEVVLMLQEGRSLGKRQLTRPSFVNNQDRRIHINISSSRPKDIQATQQPHSYKSDNNTTK